MHAAISQTGHEPPKGGLESPYVAVVPNELSLFQDGVQVSQCGWNQHIFVVWLHHSCMWEHPHTCQLKKMTVTTTTTTNTLATRKTECREITGEPLEVIDNNGEVVFAIAVTTHE
jgi:hypothetical protein